MFYLTTNITAAMPFPFLFFIACGFLATGYILVFVKFYYKYEVVIRFFLKNY